jgi:probable F420-dependent oxidoreductase
VVPHFGSAASVAGIDATCEIMEALGGDSVWVGDHVVIPFGFRTGYPYAATWYDPDDPPPYWEAFSVLAYLAARTTRLRIGTSVAVLPYRHPLLTAKMLATIDVLSGGRLVFGAGAGWFEEEFLALGLSTFGERGAVTDEQLEIIRRCWTEDRPSFDGAHYRFGELSVRPGPVQQPHPPILIGGTGRAALRRAARYGDFWHAMSMLPDEVAAGRAKLAALALRSHRRAVPATAKALNRLDLKLADMDLIELNEAFAAQVLACTRAWGFTPRDFERFNVLGSGISLGHPVGATGGRILATLLREMDRRGARYGLETMCIGGGQGLAAIFKRIAR